MATPLNLLFKRGYSSIFTLAIEGIPFLFVEKIPARVDTASAPTAPTGRAVCPGLIIDRQKLSMELDRESGIGRGRAVDFRIAYQDMEDYGYLGDIFKRPTIETAISADVSATATTISAITTAFPASGAFYLGREYIEYGNKNGPETAFEACTRAVLGFPYLHSATSIASSRYCTDTPKLWRGRFVTLTEHIVDPEGRMVESAWNTGTYQREIWRGYIQAPPVPGAVAMSLSCLPLCRLLGNPLGFSVEWQDNRKTESPWKTFYGEEYLPFYATGTERVSVAVAFTGTPSGGSPPSSPLTVDVTGPTGVSSGFFSDPELYAEFLGQEIETTVVAAGLTEFSYAGHYKLPNWGGVGARLSFQSDSPVTLSMVTVNVGSAGPYFLDSSAPWSSLDNDDMYQHEIVYATFTRDFGAGTLPWLIVNANIGVSANDFDISAPGIGVLSAGGVDEIVTWDQAVTLALGRVAIHINARGVGGSPICNPGTDHFTLTSAVGHVGTLKDSLYTVLMSSGTGTRGTGEYAFDTLAEGFGAGIPQAYLDTPSIDEIFYAGRPSTCVQSGSVSIGELMGGWITLGGHCLVDYRESGVMTLKAVSHQTGTFSTLDNYTTGLSTSDVMLSRMKPADVLEPPNPVTVDTSSMIAVGAKVTVRDAPAIQEQTAHPMEFSAPGMDMQTALGAGREMIWLSAGQYAVTIDVGLWVDVQAGDSVVLEFSHPGVYDWDQGTPGPATVSGRVSGWSRDLSRGTQSLTILLNGVKANPGLLCPTAIIAGSPSGDTVTITSGINWFQAGETALLYNKGNVGLGTPEIGNLIIDSIDTDASTITFTSTPAAWVGALTQMTYPVAGSASASQLNFFFKNSDYFWGA